MERIKTLIQEIHKIINLISIGNILINTTIIFLSTYVALTFIGFKPPLSIIPALIYLTLTIIHRLPHSKLDLVEQRFPHLEGKLMTAYDNENIDNPITAELEEECLSDIRRVKTSQFLDISSLTKKLAIIFVLGFLTLLVSSLNFGLDTIILNVQDALQFTTTPAEPTGRRGGLQEDDFDLYDELTSDAIIGTEALKLEIHQQELVDVDQVKDVEDRDFQENPFPEATFGKGAEAFEDDAPEHKAVIEEYFKSITRS